MTDLANSLAGLSLLSGNNVAGAITAPKIESKAVRLAKAQFTTPVETPIWRKPSQNPSLSAILRMPSIIDKKEGADVRSRDVANAFIAYKALERLRILAEAGASGNGKEAIEQRFRAGLQELERWLAGTPNDKLVLSFGRALRRGESVALPPATPADIRGDYVAKTRDAAIEGLTGSERFTLRISRPGATDTVSIDLSAAPQPPRLDTIAAAFNQAIAAIPKLGIDGQPMRDANGEVVSKYESRFAVVRGEKGGWGLELRSGGIEEMSLRQEQAPAALIVAATQDSGAALSPVTLSRLTLPVGAIDRTKIGELAAADLPASELVPAGTDGKPGQVAAPLRIAATASDAEGFTYAVGTAAGSVGAQVSDGADDLVLMKLDSRGRQVWQRTLGTAGTAEGVSLAVGSDGSISVAGTMQPPEGDSDLIVGRFGADGEELSLTQVRQIGNDTMQGFAVMADGGSIIAGRNANGTLTLSRLDENGRVMSRQQLAAEIGNQIAGLTVAPDGTILVLVQDGSDARLLRYATGDIMAQPTDEVVADLRAAALAVSDDGRVAVGGQRSGDGVVATVAAGQVTWSSLASGGDDKVDQLLFRGNELLVAGRTTGTLGASRSGIVDAFVARIDSVGGTIQQVLQWGRAGTRAGAPAISLAAGADSAVHRLGFNDGLLNPAENQSLEALTALRPGDRFSLRIDGGSPKQVTILEDETASSFAERVTRLIGRQNGKVTVSRVNGAPQLRFEPTVGKRIDLVSGPDGVDALAKLDLQPGPLIVPPPFDPKAPRVTPGGHYGLDLAQGLSLLTKAGAKQAMDRIDGAIATVRTGFRSLYWDDNKAALAENRGTSKGPSPYITSQLARYQDALARLGG